MVKVMLSVSGVRHEIAATASMVMAMVVSGVGHYLLRERGYMRRWCGAGERMKQRRWHMVMMAET